METSTPHIYYALALQCLEAPEARKEGLALVLWLPSRVRRIYLGSRWDSLAGLTFRFKPAIVSNDGTIR